ncbi:phenylacetate-CoA ligase [Flavobacterium caeni]|uniref:Phenylacetate-CoA ligase n=1 Tax=Flavobacterium caeni TaxID=490189 RepID=A0A1G5JAE6_9FLAO|nr:phenylacetate-CoA ligase [Flavobacterium caeni]
MFPIFDLTLRLNGFPIGQARQKLDSILAVNDRDYETFLEEKKRELAHFHLKHNPFYQALVGKDAFENWEDLPIMRKIDFQRPLAERLSNGYSEKKVFVNKTSGSSGDPMVFAKDKPCHALIWANIMRRFGWYGVDFNRSLQARFYGQSMDWFARLVLRLKDFLSHRYRFSIFDFSDAGIEKILHKFRSTQFDYINGYTSSIVQVAHYLKRKNLVLKDLCPSLRVCIVTSEMLFDDDRILLEQYLGVPVVNEYGASEVDVIAIENPDGRWLVNAETCFVEIVDENGKVVPKGQQGRILVTSLYNFAHPFIRYEVGDYGVLDLSGTAKHPVLQKLIGRTNDVAVLPSGKKPAGMTFYSITKKLFGDEGNVKEFVITQTQLDTFEIEYVADQALSEAEKNNMEKVFGDFLEPGLHYIFIRRDGLQRSKSGKLKQFTSRVSS